MDLAKSLPAVSVAPLEMFAAVFAQLPDEVQVLPTEHYFYWRGTTETRPIQGNLRFANGLRERGELSFSWTCGDQSDSPHFTQGDGITLSCQNAFTVRLAFQGRTVIFHLHELPQTPPPASQLQPDEEFVERTYDESGLQFYLIYHRKGNFFNWILDDTTAGNFTPLAGKLWHETRTGFVFHSTGQRKLLVGVKLSQVQQNTPFDGPFDQLADNYARTSGRQALLEKAVPECAGRIDLWGNYLDTPKPKRVALVPYFMYPNLEEMQTFMSKLPPEDLLERYVSRVGH